MIFFQVLRDNRSFDWVPFIAGIMVVTYLFF